MNRKVRELLWKLERKKAFVNQFGTFQKFIEWSLIKALKELDKKPLKQLKSIGSHRI